MSSIQDLRFHIRSIRNIAQVTGALETVSTSKVRHAVEALKSARPYSEKAWKVLLHVAREPGHTELHPLLKERSEVKKVLVVLVSGDRGLAGPYNMNVVRQTLEHFDHLSVPVSYVAVGKKGRDLLFRKNKSILAEFSDLPSPPAFVDVSAIGYLVLNEFLMSEFDQIYLSYTHFSNMTHQEVAIRQLLPLNVEFYGKEQDKSFNLTHRTKSVFEYKPEETELLDEIIPRFTSWQIFAAVLSSQASEHAARRLAMHYAEANANELLQDLEIEYNKIRQQNITNDILDIAGGTEALNQEQ